uniref:Uncharacterized protein n=1 Tax=Gibberella zeae TaxID=5518 RepID=A0A4E9E9X9_GIBZA
MCLNWNGVLTVIKVGSPLLYLVSRPVMVVEAFVGLRAMEPARHKIYELTIIAIAIVTNITERYRYCIIFNALNESQEHY